MMSTDNPYAAPTVHSEPVVAMTAEDSLGAIAKRTFLAWEKLRLIYIGVLGLLTLLIVIPALFNGVIFFSLFAAIIFGAVVANVCYFVGPVIDTYVTWLGYRGKWLRISLFVLGTMFACMLAFGSLASLLLPGMG